MSDDNDFSIEARKLNAINAMYEVIATYNSSEYDDQPPIEEVLLYSLSMRMAATANGETGKETFSGKLIRETVNQALSDGKELIRKGRASGTLPTPLKLINPRGGHH